MPEAMSVRKSRTHTIPIRSLHGLIDNAVAVLSNARSAAEVLEARDLAALAYDAAKRAARLGKAKQAHDDLVADAHRVQAHALNIEAQAKLRLADEYDAAQERGEVKTRADNQHVPKQNKLSSTDVGMTRKDMHEARIIRNAEKAKPGVVRRALDEALSEGKEPTRARVRRAVLKVVHPDEYEDVPGQSTPNSRFINIAWDAEHRPSEFDFPSMINHGELAAAADRVALAWSKAAKELRRLAKS
jgi:hypothetical protein